VSDFRIEWQPGNSGDAMLDNLRQYVRMRYRGDVSAALNDEQPRQRWTTSELLLASIERHLAALNWSRAPGRFSQPEPLTVPVEDRLRNLGLLRPKPDPRAEAVAEAERRLSELNRARAQAADDLAELRRQLDDDDDGDAVGVTA